MSAPTRTIVHPSRFSVNRVPVRRAPLLPQNLCSSLEGTGQRLTVGKLQGDPHGKAEGDARNLHAGARERLHEAKRGGLALDRGNGRQEVIDKPILRPQLPRSGEMEIGEDAVAIGLP